jgi:hypothetical protein
VVMTEGKLEGKKRANMSVPESVKISIASMSLSSRSKRCSVY